MLILVKLIGIVIVVMGITFLLSPKQLRQLLAFLGQGKRLYGVGILRLLFGVILLLAASQCRLVGVVLTLGILFLIGGILIFVLGLERLKSILNRWDKKSPLTLRLLGLIPLAFGALLLYSV